MIPFRPTAYAFRSVLRLPRLDIEVAAVELGQAPARTRFIPPVPFLPRQLERACRAEFGMLDEAVRELRGWVDALQGGTLGFRLWDVDLVRKPILALDCDQSPKPAGCLE